MSIKLEYRLSQSQLSSLLIGYASMIKVARRKGMRVYLVNFMFNQLPGSVATKKRIMEGEVNRVMDILTRCIVRKPKSDQWLHLHPTCIGCPDFPVYKKYQKTSLRQASVNDGMHFNAIICVPRAQRATDKLVGKRVSRLKVGLIKHFRDHGDWYLTDRLSRIYVARVKEGIAKAVGYALKGVKNRRNSLDDIYLHQR